MTQANTELSPAPHEPYIHAVVAALRVRGIHATGLTISACPVRNATMNVTDIEPAGALPDSTAWAVRCCWDERNGWSWQARWHTEAHPRQPIYFGISIAPDPDTIADWMLVSLVHPEITPDREGDPSANTDLDAVLRSYAPTA